MQFAGGEFFAKVINQKIAEFGQLHAERAKFAGIPTGEPPRDELLLYFALDEAIAAMKEKRRTIWTQPGFGPSTAPSPSPAAASTGQQHETTTTGQDA